VTRPPWLLITAWGLSLLATTLVVDQDVHYVRERYTARSGQPQGARYRVDTEAYGFFASRRDARSYPYANYPHWERLGREWRRLVRWLRFTGLGYSIALMVSACLALLSPFWYGSRAPARHTLLLFGSMAPPVGLAAFGLAVMRVYLHRMRPGFADEEVLRATWTSWAAAAVWSAALVACVVVIRAERQPRIARHPTEVFD